MILYVIESFVGGKLIWMTFRPERVNLILNRGRKKCRQWLVGVGYAFEKFTNARLSNIFRSNNIKDKAVSVSTF